MKLQTLLGITSGIALLVTNIQPASAANCLSLLKKASSPYNGATISWSEHPHVGYGFWKGELDIVYVDDKNTRNNHFSFRGYTNLPGENAEIRGSGEGNTVIFMRRGNQKHQGSCVGNSIEGNYPKGTFRIRLY
ncbi:hypothetical protein [Crocosphaera chwakensis]|uniref:Uncharacterized protein n=1 Tax=Crocosphaera chwakensis CCY0110 TaxID=391612 RepID=A3IXS1_9CHRO|nr:hypothetical protein [Crocosphaera chwakensis]EAZ88724.1 hypothetical protein CY0110_01155 [Crocosphaera chwakensis CCY0110]